MVALKLVDAELEAKLAEAELEAKRASPRTNTMLSGTVEVGGRALPVRIRNLSETGALLEGAGLPDMEARLVLKRGELQIEATVAWAGGNRRGIRFDGPTCVHEWTGGKPRPTECTDSGDQRRVEPTQPVRAGIALVTPGQTISSADAHDHLEMRLAEELAYVRRLLENIGGELAADLVVVQRHARSLQELELAGRLLSHVADIMVAKDRAAAVEGVSLDDLRARLKRKAVFKA